MTKLATWMATLLVGMTLGTMSRVARADVNDNLVRVSDTPLRKLPGRAVTAPLLPCAPPKLSPLAHPASIPFLIGTASDAKTWESIIALLQLKKFPPVDFTKQKVVYVVNTAQYDHVRLVDAIVNDRIYLTYLYRHSDLEGTRAFADAWLKVVDKSVMNIELSLADHASSTTVPLDTK